MSIGQHALFSTPTCRRNPMMHPSELHQYCKTAIKYVISYRRIGASREEHGKVGKWTVEWKPGKVFSHCFVVKYNKVRIIIQLQGWKKISCCIYSIAALWMIISMAPSSREIWWQRVTIITGSLIWVQWVKMQRRVWIEHSTPHSYQITSCIGRN